MSLMLSAGTPSTIISGLLSPMVVMPRILMSAPALGSPPERVTDTPAMAPCSALDSIDTFLSVTASPFIELTEPVRSFFFIVP